MTDPADSKSPSPDSERNPPDRDSLPPARSDSRLAGPVGEASQLQPDMDPVADSGSRSPAPEIHLPPRPVDVPRLSGEEVEEEIGDSEPWDEASHELTDSESEAGKTQDGPTLRLERKHSLAVRWMHWINFPLLFTMIWSGLLIYWADSDAAYKHPHEVYRLGLGSVTLLRFFPDWFWKLLNAPFQLPTGLAYHFFFMWLFFANGLAYVLYTVFSGEWRYLIPNRNSFHEAIQVTLHDLGLRKDHPSRRKFNGAQQIAYTGVILMGVGSLLTGFAIFKPTQGHMLTTLLGGYEVARWLHFWLTMGYCLFFVVHVAQVIRAGWNNFGSMVSGYEVVPIAEPEFPATAPHPAQKTVTPL